MDLLIVYLGQKGKMLCLKGLFPFQMSSGESIISSYYLDEKAFHLCCELFLQHSDVIRDGWSWAVVKVL